MGLLSGREQGSPEFIDIAGPLAATSPKKLSSFDLPS